MALAGMAALAACGPSSDKAELASLDKQIAGNEADPALTSALEDQILVDPSLAQQSNRNAVRPPESPARSQYPAPAEDRGASRSDGLATPSARAAACGDELDYGPGWARRLPPAFALYPGASLTEAAGQDRADCRMRVVTFKTDAAWRQVVDYYQRRAIGAGYSSEGQVRGTDHILGGVNARDGGAFYLIVTPLARGSDVALIVN